MREQVLLRVYESRLCGTVIVIVNGLCVDERTSALTLESTLQLRLSAVANVN
jgi:hypothetical protein